MPNQLSVPFKKTYIIPIQHQVRDYLHSCSGSHPDEFKWDINRWETLRKDGVGGVVHIDRIAAAVNYHAQLVSILTKLPLDIGLQISYAPAFSPNSLPISLENLVYERASVLFNLAALYSQLASNEDRSNKDGVKRAILYYQNAAGTLFFLVSTVLPKLIYPPNDDQVALDLTEAFVKSMERLMLAQAQECVWQKAVMDGSYGNGTIAKLSAKVASLYRSSITAIRSASPPIKHTFPSDWLPHLETKQYHFEAAAQYRKSIDDLEANRYGHELTRLEEARMIAKKGYDIARRGGVAPAVFQDIKSLLDTVQTNFARAERDNDLIYHHDVPPLSALPPIQEAAVAQSTIPAELQNPQNAIGGDRMIFGEMLGWGAREAINIYNNSKDTMIRENIQNAALELDDNANSVLHSLNLPSSLEALEKPVGLPPSLLKKAEEVRLEQGPNRIATSIEDVQKLAQMDVAILNEAMDILDSEASEDEAARKERPVSRPPSHEANRDLIEKERRYRVILEQAADSDEIVRQKWDEWERNINELTWDEVDLDASIPFSTSVGSKASNPQTQIHARNLRVLLETLDEILHVRHDLVKRAERLAEADDIQPRIMKAASGFERWVEVQPAMFEDVSDEEIAKYDKFLQGLREGEKKQNEILEAIKVRNESFLQSRRDDPSIKERQHALQSLDLTYHKYKEITRNLEEGMKFYNDLAGILMQFKETCKIWSRGRQQEMYSLQHALDSISINDTDRKPVKTDLPPISKSTPSIPAVHPEPKPGIKLPPLNSDEWETMEFPPPPMPRVKQAHPN